MNAQNEFEKTAERELARSWEIHRQAFGPILEPAFTENPQVRVILINALNHISTRKIKRGMELLEELRAFCIYDDDKAVWAFCVGLAFEMVGAKDKMLKWYAEAGTYGHRFYLPYLKLAKAAHGEAQFEKAKEYYEEGIACLLEMPEKEDVILGSAYTNLTSCLTMLHAYKEAETAWKTAQNYPLQAGAAATGAILYAAMRDADKTAIYLEELKQKFPAPVLYFFVFDSEAIELKVYLQGKVTAKYTDDEFGTNKNLYGIPALFGLPTGQKKRLSTIHGCADTDLKIAMLEEYFGVSLLYCSEEEVSPKVWRREKGDAVYRQYLAEEKKLSGKSALFSLEHTATYPGKLFERYFGQHDMKVKPHHFLYGYHTSNHDLLSPVRFTGTELLLAEDILEKHPSPSKISLFEIHYGTPCRMTFTEQCPLPFRGKTAVLPRGFYPNAFTSTGELLLTGNHNLQKTAS